MTDNRHLEAWDYPPRHEDILPSPELALHLMTESRNAWRRTALMLILAALCLLVLGGAILVVTP